MLSLDLYIIYVTKTATKRHFCQREVIRGQREVIRGVIGRPSSAAKALCPEHGEAFCETQKHKTPVGGSIQ